ncbi:MAG: DUF3775 domain-containing protein [Alphaproteobacteria bacterium]|nr:DUF3775 domain-containing protein [Alphaproteobacteria bacterium]
MVDNLIINPETVYFISVKAREFSAQEAPVEDNPGSNATDDGFRGVLASSGDDNTYDELKALIESLDVDEQSALVAMAWLGRGEYSVEEWDTANANANESHTEQTADYIMGMPLLSDYLLEALSQLGVSCEEWDKEHL